MPTCRACGAASPDDARYCPTCGSPFAAALSPPPPAPSSGGWPPQGAPPIPAPYPAPQGPMVRVRARPLGVAILAALDGLGCVVLVLFGLALAVAGPQVAQDPQFQQQIAQDFPGVLDPAFGPMLAALGLAAALLGVLLGVLAWGLWHGRGWAWTLAVGLTFLWLALGMVQIVALQDFSAIVGLGINGFVLWYFLQPGVKRWFGKVAAEAAMPGYVPPP